MKCSAAYSANQDSTPMKSVEAAEPEFSSDHGLAPFISRITKQRRGASAPSFEGCASFQSILNLQSSLYLNDRFNLTLKAMILPPST